MKKPIRYTNDGGEITGALKVIPDFLPTPAELARQPDRPETVKVTLEMDRSTVDWFKSQARLGGGSYQRMLRTLATRYADQHTENEPAKGSH